MVLWATLLILHGASLAGSMPASGAPENVTIVFLSPTSVRISWTITLDKVDKYDVTYKPTDASYRVVVVVAANCESVQLTGLIPNTQYTLSVAAFRASKKYRSSPVVFKTLELQPRNHSGGPFTSGGPPVVFIGPGRSQNFTGPPFPPTSFPQVRGIEVGIVLMVLLVWVGAIILFFNRWGKIRMLLPYQPDYKDTQLKVPGTGACASSSTCQNQVTSGFCCSQQHLHQCGLEEDWLARRRSYLPQLPRSRINSAIYLRPTFGDFTSEHNLNSLEPSNLRKAQSADFLPTRVHSYAWRQEHQLPIVSVSIASDSEPANQEPGDESLKKRPPQEEAAEPDDREPIIRENVS
nr:PREDICTED: uncharacterized protein LOC109042317 isoform X1 [Bemisia tabaci]XP_018914535.1 PREDICTED: uncharacterized protein LOC109042317 isoform X1 [Bemisia tabaci]XP_018914536.1 PREDICTED: uncharacterized protein LOC109042317 isoform X1 [Bemisia tabaci]XP_018914537.1 PREDICTED: uncharacterized protein LOC109042317 isoform X1 [Bemisia tabaci]